MVNSLANKVMNLLVPALPKLVKSQVSGISASLACKDCSPRGAWVELQTSAKGFVSPQWETGPKSFFQQGVIEVQVKKAPKVKPETVNSDA